MSFVRETWGSEKEASHQIVSESLTVISAVKKL
jgi:hypothetical protein